MSNSMPQSSRVGWNGPVSTSRHVRTERWERRVFFASPCRFFIDLPLDMNRCIMGAVREANDMELPVLDGGDVFATDALYRGAVLVELEPDVAMVPTTGSIIRVRDLDLLARPLPDRGVRLRAELDELVRWSLDLGHDVSAVYVQYASTEQGIVRATEVFAALKAETEEARSAAS
jgi:hypothetical protein